MKKHAIITSLATFFFLTIDVRTHYIYMMYNIEYECQRGKKRGFIIIITLVNILIVHVR